MKGGFAGTDYDTVVDHRPVTIEKDGKTYKLVSAGNYTIGKVDDQGHLTTSDAPIGKIAVGKKTVTYVYEELKQGNVVVNYVDEAGNPIKKSVEDTPESNVDTAYDTTDHKPKIIGRDGKLYLYSKVKEGDHETGKVVEETTSVTYIYKVLGRYIPFIPENPGDAYDPSKPGTNRPPVLYDETPEEPSDNPPLPYIPGYTPKDPSGNPLVPVDPDHPEKGYIPPSITDPKDPSKDTPVPYEKDSTPPSTPDTPNTPSTPYTPSTPGTPSTPNPPDTPDTLNTSNVSSSENTSNVSATSNTIKKKQLPKTGETNNTGFFASVLALIGGILLTVFRRKKS